MFAYMPSAYSTVAILEPAGARPAGRVTVSEEEAEVLISTGDARSGVLTLSAILTESTIISVPAARAFATTLSVTPIMLSAIEVSVETPALLNRLESTPNADLISWVDVVLETSSSTIDTI